MSGFRTYVRACPIPAVSGRVRLPERVRAEIRALARDARVQISRDLRSLSSASE